MPQNGTISRARARLGLSIRPTQQPRGCFVCTLSRKGAPKLQSTALAATASRKLLMKGTQSSIRDQWSAARTCTCTWIVKITHRHRRIALFQTLLIFLRVSFGCFFLYEFRHVYSTIRSLHHGIRQALWHDRHGICDLHALRHWIQSLRTVAGTAAWAKQNGNAALVQCRATAGHFRFGTFGGFAQLPIAQNLPQFAIVTTWSAYLAGGI